MSASAEAAFEGVRPVRPGRADWYFLHLGDARRLRRKYESLGHVTSDHSNDLLVCVCLVQKLDALFKSELKALPHGPDSSTSES